MKKKTFKSWILFMLIIGMLGSQFSYASASVSIQSFSKKNISVGAAPVVQIRNDFGGTIVHWKKLQPAQGYYVFRKGAGESTWKKKKIVKRRGSLYWTDRTTRIPGETYVYAVVGYRTVSSGANGTSPSLVPMTTESRNKKAIYWVPRPEWVSLGKSGRVIKVRWKIVNQASGYQIHYGTNSLFAGGKTVTVSYGGVGQKTFSVRRKRGRYFARVRAYYTQNGRTSYSQWEECSSAKSTIRSRVVYYKQRKGKKVKVIDYRKLAGQRLYGYDTFQGGASDGRYAYVFLNNRSADRCKLMKINLSNGRKVRISRPINVGHGNDITYDRHRRLLVAVNYTGSRWPRVSYISPHSLKIVKTVTIKTNYGVTGASKSKMRRIRLFSGISYSPTRRQYVAQVCGTRNFMILSENLEPVRYVNVKKKTGYMFQGISCTDDYILRVQSPQRRNQKYNSIAVYDWNGKYRSSILLNKYDEMEHVYLVGSRMYGGVYRSFAVKKYYWKKVKKKKKAKRVKKYYWEAGRANHLCRITGF